MILGLFIVFLCLAGLFVFLGEYSKESLYSLIGFFIIFILGLYVLVSGNLEYQTGYTSNTHFEYVNQTGGNPSQTAFNVLHNQTEIETIDYSYFSDDTSHLFGFILTLLGGFGIALSLFGINIGILRRD